MSWYERILWIVAALLGTTLLDRMFLSTHPKPIFYTIFSITTGCIYMVVFCYMIFFVNRNQE